MEPHRQHRQPRIGCDCSSDAVQSEGYAMHIHSASPTAPCQRIFASTVQLSNIPTVNIFATTLKLRWHPLSLRSVALRDGKRAVFRKQKQCLKQKFSVTFLSELASLSVVSSDCVPDLHAKHHYLD